MKKGLSGILTLAIGILLILAGCSAPEPTEIKLEGTVPILDLKETSALTVLLTPENADSEQLEFCTDDEKSCYIFESRRRYPVRHCDGCIRRKNKHLCKI